MKNNHEFVNNNSVKEITYDVKGSRFELGE